VLNADSVSVESAEFAAIKKNTENAHIKSPKTKNEYTLKE
jgi:hypothetical protein